jgi:hypothetical protein
MMTCGNTVVQLHVFLISALDVDGQLQAPAALPPARYPFDVKLDGSPDMDTVAKSKLVSAGNRTSVVHPAINHYIYAATPVCPIG